MSRTHAIILFLLWTVQSIAQATLSGTVTNEDGKALARVVCRLKNSNDSLLAYGFTNQQGRFSLPTNSSGSLLEFSAMGYAETRQPVLSGMTSYAVTLRKKEIELEEVTVTVAPIRRDNDTLSYNVSAFRQKEDKYIEDVLKRVPGIEVSSTGKITYQGMDINQLNIEGQNLMGEQYNLATQNMPAEAVSQIQVMENNQPIRALEGKVHSQRATLNIMLNKNYKLRPFGEVLGSIGASPCIWNNRLTALKVGTKNQLFLNVGMNNQGNRFPQVADGVSTVADLYTHEPEPSIWLYSTTRRTPPMSPLYYLQNKTAYASLNFLHAFSKASTLRLNALYYHDTTFSDDSTHNQYAGKDTVAIVHEANHLTKTTDMAKAQLRYELNTKAVYLQDELTAKATFAKSLNNLNSNQGDTDEQTRQKPFLMQNVLRLNLNTPARLIQFSSLMRLYHNRETLTVLPDTFTQAIRYHSFFMRHRVGTSFTLFGRPLILAYIMEHKSNSLTLASDTTQQGKSHYWLHTLVATYEWQLRRGSVSLHLPFEHIDYHYDWKQRHDRKWLFSPSVELDCKLGDNYTATLQAGINQDANTQDVPFPLAIIANNYRTFRTTTDSLSTERMAIASASLSYLNTAMLFSWNIYGAWTKTSCDNYQSFLYLSDFTYSFPVWRDNQRCTWSAAYNLKKIVRHAGLTLSHSGHYSYNKALASQNQVEDLLRYHVFSTDASLVWNRLHWLHLSLSAAGNVSWKRHDAFSASSNVLKNAYYSLRSDFFPTKRLQVYADFTQTTCEIAHSLYSTNCFLNAGMAYDLTKGVAIELSGINLLNRKSYQESRYDGANRSYYSVPLRHREVMLGLRMRF